MESPPGARIGYTTTRHGPAQISIPKTPRTYHVWVNLSGHSKQPVFEYSGLVLGWRRTQNDWEAQVLWVTPKEDRHDDTAHLGWVPVHQLAASVTRDRARLAAGRC